MIRRVTAALATGAIPGALAATLTIALAATPAYAAPTGATPGAAASHRAPFPTVIQLPNGWGPEGITIGRGAAYFGSLVDGSIFRADLATGQGRVISTGPGTPSVGLKIDALGRLFVSGGPAGNARVVDSRTGKVLASYQLTTAAATFINDVVLTPDAAWFTDSTNQQLYKLPLRHGRLPTQAQVVTVPLTGDIMFQDGFNANGIARTPDGRGLLVVQSNTAELFRVNPATGATRLVDLGGEALTDGDGLLVVGRTLFVVQNMLNTVAVFRLNAAGTRGRLVTKLTDPRLDVPTTVAAFGNRLYLANARFSTPTTPTTTYTAVALTL